MQFTAEEYYQAALERMQEASRIYRAGNSYALAMYCAGLSVECMLRAFRWTAQTTFEGRHDLSELLKSSGLLRIDEDHLRRRGASEELIRESALKLQAATNVIFILWHNNLRFASETRLKAFLRRMNRLKGIKGNPLKKNALDLIDAAQTVINRGVALWTSNRR